MELNHIRQPYDYNRSARQRILTVARTLASDDFIGPEERADTQVSADAREYEGLPEPKAQRERAARPTQR